MKRSLPAVFTRRIGVLGTTLAIAATGMVVMAGPASAAYTDCPNNYVCLWAGANASGDMIFAQSGTTMNNTKGYYSVLGNENAYSSDNRTLGKFCTYGYDWNGNFIVTNILATKTSGNLSSHNTWWVKAC